ncbi:MAG: hypothetical protein A2521_14960 [Deltaproteobacteria bacterium RIFOXYD12_FULL_57_12]|nr:MAG: hypothetical protein A2521_14960 [Deltaproteobacteria bacterium RIFOXYD12_FULL_57_12]
MQPIDQLLHRIRWDREFGRAIFEIGYYDRVEERIIKVAFSELVFAQGAPHCFQLVDPVGLIRTVPFHRVREVYRDGQLIWQRQG